MKPQKSGTQKGVNETHVSTVGADSDNMIRHGDSNTKTNYSAVFRGVDHRTTMRVLSQRVAMQHTVQIRYSNLPPWYRENHNHKTRKTSAQLRVQTQRAN
jgi:hypothetical protein